MAEWDSRAVRLGSPRRLTLDDRWDYSRGHWTDDSSAILFQSNRGGTWDIFRQRLDSPLAEPIVIDAGDDQEPAVSPDGAWILYWQGARLMRRPASGGPAELVLESDQLEFQRLRCAYPPATRCVLVEEQAASIAMSELDPIRGRGRRLATVPRDSPGFVNWDLSTDGTRIALVDFGDRVRFIELRDGSVRSVAVPGWTAIEFVGWAADGKGVFIQGFSGRGPRLTNTALLYLTVDGRVTVLRHEQNEWHILPRASPDGSLLAFSTMIFESNAWLIESRPQEGRR